MGKLYDEITEEHIHFIEQQNMFFVGTAAEEGTVNISPKGMDSFRVISNRQIAWLNLTGSGNESSAHVQINPRMTIMFCAFEGAPLILRLYGQARVLHRNDDDWEPLVSLFPETAGTRQVFVLDIDQTQSSCGKAVPLYEFNEQRDALKKSSERRGQKGIEQYWLHANQKSLDGFPTRIKELTGLEDNPEDNLR
ncbi:pyridoxamine 5'-phosphate oxidase family protein [Endozoicomonas numazuensis]|uniref:Pyridoxamine 5'-phosphate oxidase n=1 Tax=Endozoicomonas numazuensis TaxID=1137799 RepID=A0A081NCQ5_9GAMM|nr:pyridoxamine 5'-phosphate oxidase family protein [Endozoicomonas numazuensis]KEQ16228.1 pyridoxamine 5'-phosphate oxidase [Endozoicomonas numazuensis]